MASGITHYQLPQLYMPAFNKQVFNASSTNYAQPNFTYTIVVTDVITGQSNQIQVPPQPDFSLSKDVINLANKFIRNFIPVNSYGWKVCTGAVRQIKVNIGETYDVAGVSTYTAGTDKFYIIWNGVRDLLEFQSYNYLDFVFKAQSTNIKYLTDQLDEVTYEGRSNLFYALTSQKNDINWLIVKTYTAAGVFIAQSEIPNPQTAGTTYTNKYICIDLGHKGLTNISAGDVTGAFPIITASVAYYEVYDSSDTGPILTPVNIITKIKRYTIGCSPRYDVVTLHYLAKKGHFRSVQCALVSERTSTVSRNTFKKSPYEQLTPLADVTYTYEAAVEQTLDVSVQDKLRVNTDWLTKEESALYKELITSPSVYMDLGTGQGYASMKVTDTSYATKKYYNEKLFQLTINLDYTHDNHRQTA